MSNFNERAWHRVTQASRFPVENVSGTSFAVSLATGSALSVQALSGTFLGTTVSSSLSAPIYVVLPADHQISIIHNLGLLLEEQKKTNLYLAEILGDKF